MNLCQIVYVSLVSEDLKAGELEKIVSRSIDANAGRNVTGVLLCCGRQLMQLIEGEEATVDALFAAIQRDPRHGRVECLMRKRVDRRMFGEWNMKLIDVRNGAQLDRNRLSQMVDDLRARHNTARHSVEARMLLHDFQRQLAERN